MQLLRIPNVRSLVFWHPKSRGQQFGPSEGGIVKVVEGMKISFNLDTSATPFVEGLECVALGIYTCWLEGDFKAVGIEGKANIRPSRVTGRT